MGQSAEGPGRLRPASPATAPTTMWRPSPIRPCWPPAACPTRASPIGSRPSGSPSCATTPPASAPILLKINMEAGHGGASGRFDFLKEIALDYAFAVWAVERGWETAVIDPRRPRRRRGGAGGDLRPPRAARPRHLRGDAARRRGDGGARWRRCTRCGLPYLVAEIDGAVVGFAYAAPFRPRAAYRYTVEDSVYVAPDRMGQGVGKALLTRGDRAPARRWACARWCALIGDSGNAGSIGLHRSLGFEPAGCCGRRFKHGRWVDVVVMQKRSGRGRRLRARRAKAGC